MEKRLTVFKAAFLFLSLFTLSKGQSDVAFDDICLRKQGISDNLSCPDFFNNTLICYPKSELCNGVEFCADGSDEGRSLNSLDCTGMFTGRTEHPIPAFVCKAGEIVEIEQLCDGKRDCSGGDDETTPLCENKCLYPYYGSCDYTRECINSDLDLNCGLCRPGYARQLDINEKICVPASFSFSLPEFSERENLGPLSGSVVLTTNGVIERNILVIVETVPGGTATANVDYSSIVTTLVFPRSSRGDTIIPFSIPLMDERLVENQETFQLTASITVPPRHLDGVFSFGGDSATAVIIDNDQLIVKFEFSVYSVIEGNVVQEVCLVRVNDDQLETPGMVQIYTTNGLAIAGEDYDGIPLNQAATVTFGPDSSRECFNVMIRDDVIIENEECFQIDATSLSPTSITVLPEEASTSVCIMDDDNTVPICVELREIHPYIKCCEDDTVFCPIQCRRRKCVCVDPETGEIVGDGLYFYKGHPFIDCETTFPTVPPSTTEPPTDGDSSDTSQSGSSDSSKSGSTKSNSDSSDTSQSGSSDSSKSGSTKSNSDSSDTSQSGSSDSSKSGSTAKTLSKPNSSRHKCTNVQKLVKNGCSELCIEEDGYGCPACDSSCNEDHSLPVPCMDCTENQVCLRMGRFGQRTCVDLLINGERCGSDGDSDSEDDSSEDSNDKSSAKKTKKKSDDDSDSDSEDDSSDDSSNKSSAKKTKKKSKKHKISISGNHSKGKKKDKARKMIKGAEDRHNFGALSEATPPCADGLVCTRVSIGMSECRPENVGGVCVVARETSPKLHCAADGSYRALQCSSEQGSSNKICVCVQPDSGSVLPGTEVSVTDLEDAPNCDDQVFEKCIVKSGRHTYSVPHGEYIINMADCTKCLCENGEETLCESSVCRAFSTNLQDTRCEYDGHLYEHGETFDMGCNKCGCRNGNVECVHMPCEETRVDERCESCKSTPRDLVCTPNGKTYQSQCSATYCGGYPAFDLLHGPCADNDICELYPCAEEEVCIKKGGIFCLDPNGCEPNELRLCVDTNALQCDGSEDERDDDGEDTSVCGTNGQTYPSLCRLLQDTANEDVAYVGDCEREECDRGPVCGTDGVTYENICVLRSQSGNARVDYRGECNMDKETPEGVCERVNRFRRCAYNISNCDHLVMPEEGCCALCGGIVFIAIDFRGIGEYMKINPSMRTVDNFIGHLIESGFITEEITSRCEIGVSLTSKQNLQIILEARTRSDEAFCGESSDTFASWINDPNLASGIVRPQVLQFASAAVSGEPLAVIVQDVVAGTTATVSSLCLVLFLQFVAILSIMAQELY